MKRLKQILASVLCVLMFCTVVPAAFASSDGKVTIYFETNGGTGISIVEQTNSEGKLSSLPTPTMVGYTFAGWYNDPVAGDQIKVNETKFTEDSTIYAHWNPIDQSEQQTDTTTEETEIASESGSPLENLWNNHKATILLVSSVFLLAGAGFVI